MPGSEATQFASQGETPSGYFNTALMEIDSYFDLPAPDPKQAASRLPTAPSSPSLGGFRNSPSLWNTLRESPGFQSYGTDLASIETSTPQSLPPNGIAPLQTTIQPSIFLGNPSPPQSSDGSPNKFLPGPGDISPLDSLIVNGPLDNSTRTLHGQVTPPEDTISPRMRPVNPQLILPMELTPPEGSPASSPRTTHARGFSASSMASDSTNNRKRRSSTAGSSSRKQRKSVADNDPPEVQEAKRKRFLERNRVAASKCRQKKKAWMQDLEQEAREAQAVSKQLRSCVSIFKEEILQLKSELLKHNTCDCTPIRQYLSNEALRLANPNPDPPKMCVSHYPPRPGLPPSTSSMLDAMPTPTAMDMAAFTTMTEEVKIEPGLAGGSEFELDFADTPEGLKVM